MAGHVRGEESHVLPRHLPPLPHQRLHDSGLFDHIVELAGVCRFPVPLRLKPGSRGLPGLSEVVSCYANLEKPRRDQRP